LRSCRLYGLSPTHSVPSEPETAEPPPKISFETEHRTPRPDKKAPHIHPNQLTHILPANKMTENIYDEIEIEDMTYDTTLQIYHYPCPCGDRFEIGIADLRDGEDIAVCPSCSLMIRVVFEVDKLPKEEDETVKEQESQVPVMA
jgi:diphthamide biosynthesis protein 3